MRTTCRRTAFQQGSNDLVRISLDSQVQMTSEQSASDSHSAWCRDER